jgi:hypothetical protein
MPAATGTIRYRSFRLDPTIQRSIARNPPRLRLGHAARGTLPLRGAGARPELGVSVGSRLGGGGFLVFLPKERLARLFQAEAVIPTADGRLLQKDEIIRPKDANPHAGLIEL